MPCRLTATFFGALAAACAPQIPDSAPQRLRVATPAPAVATARPGEPVAEAAARARRAAAAEGGRLIEPAAAPFLFGAPAGRRFLAAPPPRALARGAPAGRCPGLGLGTGPRAPTQALRACLAAQPEARDCGCALLAVDDAVLSSQPALAYAPGVGGRLLGVDDARFGVLVVEEAPGPATGDTVARFLDGAATVAVAELRADGAATLTLPADGRVFFGRRERRGWRRGRLTERLLLEDATGDRIVALIGFEPADIAAEGVALGAWTPPG